MAPAHPSPLATRLKFGVVILAAGASSRMGRPKLLLPWGTTSVLGYLLELWQPPRAHQVGVVLAPEDPGLVAELDRLRFPNQNRILNPNPEEGMFSSVRCAAHWPGWNGDLTHWILSLGDQPHVQVSTLDALLASAARHPQQICQPSRRGRPKHPVILPKLEFEELRSTQEPNLKLFLTARALDRVLMDTDDVGLDLDIDYPADYEKALELFRRAY
jgi:molybdenum cofactor cytidylyltransferase